VYPSAVAEERVSTPVAVLLWRAGRFLYLLWGGMLLMRRMSMGSPSVPHWVWDWSGFAAWLVGPFGGGLLFGVGLAMAVAALGEVWELVDLLLLRLTRSRGGDW